MIRVLLVDDSPVALAVLQRMLAKSRDIQVVGTAANGKLALELLPLINPEVICTDLHMPVMDGLEFTKEVMARQPLPILLVSVSGNGASANAFKVLEAGAIDVFQKPRSNLELDFEKHAPALIAKIKILAGVRVFRRRISEAASPSGIAQPTPQSRPRMGRPEVPLRMAVIGASTGGPQALQTILTRLPADFPLPIICVQHISDGFLPGLIDWLASQCRMRIEIARPGALPKSATIYFPPEGTHLKFDNSGRFAISSEPPLAGHRPSVTVTMQSLAGCPGNPVLAVLLTGMGRDGAEGMLAVKRAGGITIAQDEASSAVFGMPQQAIALGAAQYVVPLHEIGAMLVDFTAPLRQRKE
jgi:two-component system chemotaxis response regulator CheB